MRRTALFFLVSSLVITLSSGCSSWKREVCVYVEVKLPLPAEECPGGTSQGRIELKLSKDPVTKKITADPNVQASPQGNVSKRK